MIQEGGYNIDYLGQHASGVARALIEGPEYDINNLEPVQADLDVNINKI